MNKITKTQEEIYEYFIFKFGAKMQRQQVAEECSELSLAILKQNRNKTGKEMDMKVIEEIGDVLNAIESYLYMYGVDIEDVNSARLAKLENYYNKIKD